jgi:hypothetical protein
VTGHTLVQVLLADRRSTSPTENALAIKDVPP